MMVKNRLFTPGPTPVPEQIMLEMAKPLMHHRHAEFLQLLKRVNGALRYLFQTKQNVYSLTSSGTGAMEAAVCNLLSPGDTALFVNGGKFGERWGEICSAYGVQTEEVTVEWGSAVDPKEIERRLKRRKEIRAVFVTHSETSTGVAHDVKEIAKSVNASSDAIVVVDGISSVGALEMRMDDWNIDVLLTGSQKGLMIPPGLSFIALGQRAWNMVAQSRLPKYYFDLTKANDALDAEGTPWTPAVSLMVGLDAALAMIRTEGIEQVWKRHRQLATAVRAGCEAIGLQLFAHVPSDSLTALLLPLGVNGGDLSRLLKSRYGFTVAGGQGKMKGKLLRISHLGYYDAFDVIAMVSALEMALRDAGWKFSHGDGVKAAQTVLLSPA